MPCRDYMDDYPSRRESEDNECEARMWMLKAFISEAGAVPNVQTLDGLSTQLCALLRKKSDILLSTYSKELQDWWIEHQKADRRAALKAEEFVKKAKMKTSILKKLTAEEIKFLGW